MFIYYDEKKTLMYLFDHSFVHPQCKNVPPPGVGVEVVDRFVRICLFDGRQFLSNVHTVKAELIKLSGKQKKLCSDRRCCL